MGRILLLGTADVVAAALLALLVFRMFGAYSGQDTNPAVCFNTTGNVVSCSLTPTVLMLPTLVVTLLALVAWQVSRRRHRQLRSG